MDGDRLRKVGALVLAGALLLAATPAATAAPGRMAEQSPTAPSFFDGLTAWMSLWLDAGPISAAVALWQAAGTEDGPGGAEGVSRAAAEDDPTATPQLGSEADPDG